MPIAFGPKLRRFPEAQELVSIGVAQVIGKQVDFDQWVTTHVLDKKMREEKVIACRQFVSENAGATQRVMDIIGPYLNK
jgi:3-deoxy-D-manno-octulosonic-acid transferase